MENLYNKDITLNFNKIKFRKQFVKNISKITTISETENSIKVSDIKDMITFSKITYEIAKEIAFICYKDYFKPDILKLFGKEKTKEILNLHTVETTECNYFEFLIKVKLTAYFLNSYTLNIDGFMKFDTYSIKEEMKKVVKLEEEFDGNLLTEIAGKELVDGSLNLNKKETFLLEFVSQNQPILEKKVLFDLHLFQKGNMIYCTTEKGANITYESIKMPKGALDETFKRIAEDTEFYETELGKRELFLSAIYSIFRPERVFIYSSLDEQFRDNFLETFCFINTVFQLNVQLFDEPSKSPTI